MHRTPAGRRRELEKLVLPDRVRERIFAGFLQDNGTILGPNELRSLRFEDSPNSIIAWQLDDAAREKLRRRPSEERTLARLVGMLMSHMQEAPAGAAFLFLNGDRISGLPLWLELDDTRRLENARVHDADGQINGKLPDEVIRISGSRKNWKPHGVVGGRCMIIGDGRFAHVRIDYSASSDYESLNTLRVMPREVLPREVVVYSAINHYAEEPTADMLKQLMVLGERGANAVLIVGHNKADGRMELHAWCLVDSLPPMPAAVIDILAQAAWNATMRAGNWEVSDLCMPMDMMVQLAQNWGTVFGNAIANRLVRQIPIVGADGKAIETI